LSYVRLKNSKHFCQLLGQLEMVTMRGTRGISSRIRFCVLSILSVYVLFLYLISYNILLLHHSSTTAVALVACQVPHHLQDHNADAPHSTRSMSVVSRRPGCIRHGRLSTTLTQVVANQSCGRETDTNPIWQMRLLGLWSQHMEQSSSISPQH